MNPLKQLETCGQSPRLDYLKRGLIAKGELRNLLENDGGQVEDQAPIHPEPKPDESPHRSGAEAAQAAG